MQSLFSLGFVIMYEAYFGLKENPFTLSPDPRYLYLSTQHQEALNCLIYGMKKKGSSSPPAGLGPGRRLSVAPFWPVWTE